MKLFTQYNRANIAAMIISFVAGSIAFYIVLNIVLTNQLDRSLRVEEQEITDYTNLHGQLPFIPNTRHQWLKIDTVNTVVPESHPLNIELINPTHGKKEHVRQLVFGIQIHSQFYRITVNQSRTETEGMLQLIIMIALGMIFLMLLLNYFINRRLMARLWQPFYHTINRIREYEAAKSKPLEATNTNIEEIDLLNESISRMTIRIYNDYTALRTFAENASHEMQTPLSIIRLKTETLLQQLENNPTALQQLFTIEDAANKLSKLHQSLLLLTRLENKQYSILEEVNIEQLLKQRVGECEELIGNIHLKFQIYTEKVILLFHQQLADILIGNLFSNMLRHSPAFGEAFISLNSQYLEFSNTAISGPLDNNKVFKRFYKGEQSKEGTGLGLAIVQEICNVAGFSLHYNYKNNLHIFTVKF
jgi:signal transduction histidine kinase